MDTKQHMIIDLKKNEFITSQIRSINYDSQSRKYIIKFDNDETLYNYNSHRIKWLKNPKSLNPELYKIYHNNRKLFDIVGIYFFRDDKSGYLHICFSNKRDGNYSLSDLEIDGSCLIDKGSCDVFKYLNETANVERKEKNIRDFLVKQYKKLAYISKKSVLSTYLNPSSYENNCTNCLMPIFPFGCNASQYKAVKAALENKISVIQGPPGTGKTQTILNIIANLLIKGCTVMVVSNNNSATKNVLEKLSAEKYGLDFLVAQLGKYDNKEIFVRSQTGRYPDLSDWCSDSNMDTTLVEISEYSRELEYVFSLQERLALVKQEMSEIKVEQQHFEQYTEETNNKLTQYKIREKLKSKQLMHLWQECQYISDNGSSFSLYFKIKNTLVCGITDWTFYKNDVSKVINAIQSLFYQTRLRELESEIKQIEETLKSKDASGLSEQLVGTSMQYLRNLLYKKYGHKTMRPKFSEEDLWQKSSKVLKEYPVILSSTYSSRNSLNDDILFDYVIMDEASQIDITTGALALSCAKNAVIVGDTKQLPNVVSDEQKKKYDEIFEKFNINEGYRYSNRSFLQSICELFPSVPQTLLNEHYRCHPKIINFCNHKFYDGELLIMSSDNGEDDVLSVIKTTVGNHARKHVNQRQIDIIKEEILPNIKCTNNEVGIISPYKDQADELNQILNEERIDISTVHKFQGREKEVVILTTVDNEISDFADNPQLLNVAISRAKKHLHIIVSGNEQPKDSNIMDLVSYIEYNNFSVVESKIYSIFDYLYKQYTRSRIEFLKSRKRISEYDSENLMYALVETTLKEMKLSCLGVICHMPLQKIIRDLTPLNPEEAGYVANIRTHLDIMIFNKITKKPVLAIEVDGVRFHKKGSEQAKRDEIKNRILDKYEIPYLRFATNGSGEKERLVQKLKELLNV